MSSVADLVQEMLSLKMMMSSRAGAGGKDPTALMKKYASSVAMKIGRLNGVDPNAATQLHDAAKNSGLPEDSRAVIVMAIDAKFEQEIETEPEVAASTRRQLLTNAPAYVTASLVKSLKGPGSVDSKIMSTADFLANTLGCVCPHEQTYRFWLTLVLQLHCQKWPKYKAVHGYLLDLKQALKDCKKKWPLPKIAAYPKVPQELPESVFNHIYGNEEPSPIVLERYEVSARCHVPLRKNSKLIVNEEKRAGLPAEVAGGRAPETNKPQSVAATPVVTVQDEEEMPLWAKRLFSQQSSASSNQFHTNKPPTAHVVPDSVEQTQSDEVPAWASKLLASQCRTDVVAEPIYRQERTVPASVRPRIKMRSDVATVDADRMPIEDMIKQSLDSWQPRLEAS